MQHPSPYSKYFRLIVSLLFGACTVITFSSFIIHKTAEPFLFNSVEEVPYNEIGLVLGTSKFTKSGEINPYYQNRINTTVKLYYAGKIDYILVSGDNSTKYYNEPMTMKNDLMRMGIPSEKIVLDYAGFRTLDSVVRANKVFAQKKFTIISQKFHNERALFIARNSNIEAIAFNAQDISLRSGLKTMARESLARVKAVIDVFVINKQPKFLGKQEDIHASK